MKQKISLRRFGKPVSYILIALMLLPVLLSATAPRVVAEPDGNWVTPSAVNASSGADNMLADFETDPGADMDGWTYSEQDTNNKISPIQDTGMVKHGSYNWKISCALGTELDDYGKISKTFNLTNIDILKVWIRLYRSGGTAPVKGSIIINETEEWSHAGPIGATEVEIDVSGLSGNQSIVFKYEPVGSGYTNYMLIDYLLAINYFRAVYAIDDNTSTKWRPAPANETGAWMTWDVGNIKILTGCRIYWGADAAYRPTAYRIQTSSDDSSWTTVITETEAPPASAWKEYSWDAVENRYIKLIVDTHGSSGTEIYEMDYNAGSTPNPPTGLLSEGMTNPTHVLDHTPEFSAIGTDNDSGDNFSYHRMQVDDDSDFTSPIWDSGKTSITTFENGVRCEDIEYSGSALSEGVTYYWQIKFWDSNNLEGDWSSETATFVLNYTPAVVSITVNNALVDRRLDYTGSGAVLTTTVTIRVQDNDGYDEIQPISFWMRDNNDSVFVDNLQITDNTVIDDNTSDFTYTYNPLDNLPDDNLGSFDVNVVVDDIWGASDNNDWGGDGEAIFTVDDDNTTFNFDPTSPYYRWEENVSGTISRIAGTASADNVWFKDNIYDVWWYLGSGNAWSENYIVNAEPGENVKVFLKVYDPPLDGLFTSSYMVNENWQFQIDLRYEDNFELFADPKGTENSIENQGIWAVFHFIEYEESEQQITDNTTTFTVSYEADYVRVVFLLGTDNEYSRRYIIDSREIVAIGCEKEDLANLSLYTFKIYEEDTYTWGPPEGRMGIFKFHENQRYYVVKRYWTGTSDASVWLKFGQDYNLWLYTPTEGGIDYGTIQGDTNYVKLVYPSRFGLAISEEIVSTFSDVIAWSYYIDVYGNLVIEYLDNSEGTNWVFINVTELENYTVAWYDNVADSPNDFLTTWNGYENNVLYDISLQINHDNFGFSPVWSWGMTGITTPISEWDWGMLGEATGKLGSLPVAFLNLAVLGLSVLILASFESGAVGFGVVALAIILGMLKLILPIPLDWTVLSILAFLGVVSQIFRRRGK